MRVLQQAAYVLINRPYSETSWIVEVLTRDFGRLSLMAKGARRQKSPLRGALLAFQPLVISWTGKGEVPTLTQAEIDLKSYSIIENELHGDSLVCGFYCNELIIRLLHRHDAHRKLFDEYRRTLIALSLTNHAAQNAEILREFEQSVMRESGYAIDFNTEADGRTEIDQNFPYQFIAGRGFVRQSFHSEQTFTGRIVLSLGDRAPVDLGARERAQARDLMRTILQSNLNHSTIVSRSLFYPKAPIRAS